MPVNPDPPIVLSMQTTLADALLWLLGKLAVWTIGDAITEALWLFSLLGVWRFIYGLLACFWPAFNRFVQRRKQQA